MKTLANKQLLVGADGGGFDLKEAVVKHFKDKGWEITDVGLISRDQPDPPMFQRVGFKVGSLIAEGEFEKALIFCGTGMGIHIAASKCPHTHVGVVESIPAAKRAACGNGCNILSMGANYVAPAMGIEAAEEFLSHKLGDGFEAIPNFKEYHQLAKDEIEAFDYEAYKANGFEPIRLGDIKIGRR